MSDTEQPKPTEQPSEEQPPPAEEQSEPAQPSVVDGEEAGDAGSQEAEPIPEPSAEPEPQPEETPVVTEQETQPTNEEPAATTEEVEAAEPVPSAEPEVEEKPEEKKEEEIVPEEPVVITPDDSPFWLLTDEVLAKGLPSSEVENFKNFYFKQTHSLQARYDQLKDVVVQTEFITLSREEIDALSTASELSEEQQQVLTSLEDRVNQAIELFEEDGAIVKVNGRSAKDTVLGRNEEAFIAEIRDAVVNELEVEKQRANAYAIWKEQEKHPSAFKRGLNSIRQSFRRGRVQSSAKREEKPKLEEDDKKADEPKSAETDAAEAPPPAVDGQGEEAASGEGAEVTVQVDVEGGDSTEDKPEEAPTEQTPAETPAEQPTDEPLQADIEEAPKTESEDVEEAPKKESDVAEDEPKKEGEDAEEVKKDEIEKVEEQKEEEPKPKASPEHVHHKLCKAKHETLPNQIVKAFISSTSALFKVKSGKEAIDVLRRSVQIRSELNQLKAFGGIEGVQVSVSVSRWQEQLSRYPGMEFRGYVYKNELNALSQYNNEAYYPNVDTYYNMIQAKVQDFFKKNIQDALKELDNYIIDFFVTPEKVLVVRLNPFYTAIDASLFSWAENGKVLTQGPFEFRIVETPKAAPEAFSSFQPFWQTMLDSVLQQRVEPRPHRSCVLL